MAEPTVGSGGSWGAPMPPGPRAPFVSSTHTGSPAQSFSGPSSSPRALSCGGPLSERGPRTGGPPSEKGLKGMAVIAAVIEVGSDPPIKGLDPSVSEVCGRPLGRVPVVRVYGPWGLGGPQCCLHIHGFFPYFYVAAPPEAYGEGAPQFLRAFARSLVLHADRLMAAKAAAGGSNPGGRMGGPRKEPGGPFKCGGGPLVYKIEVVRRLPFYGYHRELQAFLKISLTKPKMVGPLAALLLQGVVTGAPLQPYEVHFNFETQFLADLHLRGMDAVFIRGPLFRAPVPLDLLTAGGFTGALWRAPFVRGPSLGGPPLSAKTESPSSVLNILGVGAPATIKALGWGELVRQLTELEKAAAAARATKAAAAAAASPATPPDGPAAAKESASAVGAAHCSGSSSSSGTYPVSQMCEEIWRALPPRGPQGLRLLGAPRLSKCALEADARVDQVLNPIVAAEKAAAAAATEAQQRQQQQQQQQRRQEEGQLTQGKHQLLSPPHSSGSSTSHTSTGSSNSTGSSASSRTGSSSTNSSSSSSNAFAARLLGSVSDYWTEEVARASAWGFPPPSAGTGRPQQEGSRDPQGAPSPEFWQAALKNIIRRLEAWKQEQQQQQREGSSLPLQRVAGPAQPRRRQQQQQQQGSVAGVSASTGSTPRFPHGGTPSGSSPPLGFSQVWETTQISGVSEAESDVVCLSQGLSGVSAIHFAYREDSCAAGDASLAGNPVGNPQEGQGGPCPDVHDVEGPPKALRMLLEECAPPSQRAPAALGVLCEEAQPAADGFNHLASLKDEDFAVFLASQGPQGPPISDKLPASPGGALTEVQEGHGSCSADCSSLSDRGARRNRGHARGDLQAPGEAADRTALRAGDTASGRSSGCCCSSSCKRCSSDLEDLLLVFEGKTGKQEKLPMGTCSCPAACRRSSSSNSRSNSSSNSSSSSKACDAAVQAAVTGGEAAGDALVLCRRAPVGLEVRAAADTTAEAGEPVAAAAAAAEAEADLSLEAIASCSSAYAPTVRLGPASSCDDLSPTQSFRSPFGAPLHAQYHSLGPQPSATAVAGAAATAAATAEPRGRAAETTLQATAEAIASAAATAVAGRTLGKTHRRSNNSSSGGSKDASPTGANIHGSGPVTDSDDSVRSVSQPAAAAAAENEEEEITPFFSNPLDVPAAVNPLKATPGGRLLLLQQQGSVPPPCACKQQAPQETPQGKPSALRSHLLRFIQKQRQQQRMQQPPHEQQQHLKQQQQQRQQLQQRYDGEALECFVYFRPPPDRAQVFASCPLRVRRKWSRTAQQQQQQQQQQECKHAGDAAGIGGQQLKAEQPEHQQQLSPQQHQHVAKQLQQQQQQQRHGPRENTECKGESSAYVKSLNPEAFTSSSTSSRSISKGSRQKVRMLTKLDNQGRIVGYIAPVHQQQEDQEEEQQDLPAAAAVAAPTSSAAAFTSQKSSGSSSSSSQQHQDSQISVSSDVRRARQGLHAQQAALSGDPRSWRPLGAPQQFANYGTLMALEVIADCRPSAATEAAAGAAVPNPWNCSALAICFILRDERLQLCAARLQHKQQQQQRLYQDVRGVILWDSVASVGGPASKGQRLEDYIDREWLACIVPSEKDLLLQFCAVVAAADPTLIIQWEAGARGLAYLNKRAQALGLGQLFGDRCSRRADDLSSPVKPVLARSAAAGATPAAAAAAGGGSGSGRGMLRRGRRWVRGSAAVSGRLVLEAWRLLQREIKLHHSDLNGVASEVLGFISPTVPSAFSAALWQQAQQARRRARMQQQQQQQQLQREELWALKTIAATLLHVMNRVDLTLRLLDWSEVIPRTCELARLYGCCLHAALTRGSQFKVENVLIRATKKLHAVLVSPSKRQVTEQPATVCVPLVLEPLSGFYFSPVLVLDFLSLYPSVVIANNICYSTCLGSVEVDPLESETKTLGVVAYHAPPQIFAQVLQAHADAKAAGPSSWGQFAADEEPLRVLPGGAVFVSRRVRQGVLPAILNDMLQTRLMVKQAAKRYSSTGLGDEGLLRKLNYRQFGLKMIANVTYGYTNANVSGRMPCAEVADSIVQTARATLLRAMQLVEETERWNAKVLYGDTDSVFVLLKGRSLEAAFQIGKEIAEAVTRSNPPPIQLQLEKVFLPCCLVTKKRYVGNAYHSPSGPPTFDAKGIESIRRDQCPLTSALLEKSLRILFETRDLSKVKALLYRQWSKMLRGQIPIRHYIFQRKAKLGSYRAETGKAQAGTLPPQAKVLYERLFQRDGGGDESGSAAVASLYGSRVSFVFSHVAGDTDVPVGAPGAKAAGRLIDAATAPENVWGGRRDYKDLLALLRGRVFPSFPPLPFVVQDADDLQQQQQHEQQHPVMQLHYRYYITKQIIPALDRLFSLLPPPATADLPQWFREMPKPAHRSLYTPAACSSAPPMQHQQQQEQQQKQQQQQQQQSLLQTLGIKSITAGGAAARERLVLQRFFAAASCILCGSKCRELGPTPLRLCDKNNNSRGFGASGIPKKRRVALRTKGPQATEELALRRGLLMQLHKTSFSSSSSSSSGDEGSRGSVVLKGKRKAERIDVSKEREVTPPPVCEACSSNPAAVYVELQQRLRKIEERIAAARNLCYHCAGSREYAEACLHSWHCDVYFRRISEANKLRILQQQMQNLGLFVDN